MKARLIRKYQGIYMSTQHIKTDKKTAPRPTGFDGIVVPLDGYDAS